MINVDGETEFLGYREAQAQATIRGLFQDGQSCERAEEGDEIVVILDRTPFYGESGGQIGDTGYLTTDSAKLEVRDTTKAQGHHLHHAVVISGAVAAGDTVMASIDQSLRNELKRITLRRI